MDIIIKSFNRPYYLDRCLQSIYKNVADADFTIKILDDGTPEKYLQRLIENYPEIQIYKSESYNEKSAKIVEGASYSGNIHKADIPIKLWIEAAQNATDYFLLLEDDIWLTEKINLKVTQAFLTSKKIFFLKLFWLGNDKLVESKLTEKTDFISVYKPQLFTSNPLLFRLIFRMDRLKSRAILTFLRIYSKDRFLKYYTIYSVAGVIFKKEYFLNLWKDHKNSVDEHLQLFNAVKYYHKNNAMHFARTNVEVARTGFLSSATNQHKNYEGIHLDMFELNRILNEAWYDNGLDAMGNFPKDLDEQKIATILEKANKPMAQREEWQKWVGRFKQQFRSFGCNID